MAGQICGYCKKEKDDCYCSPNSVCDKYEPEEKDKVLEFINKRFPVDCRWLNGNCYYFSVILKERFPEGEIWYDMIDGHFLFECGGRWYDWIGLCKVDMRGMVRWDELEDMDKLLYDRIVRDCVR